MNVELAGAPADVQYFGWALQHLPAASALAGLLAVPNAVPAEFASDSVRDVYRQYLYGAGFGLPEPYGPYSRPTGIVPGLPRYVDIVSADFSAIISAPDEVYDADRQQHGSIDALAYQAMLAAFLGGFAGDSLAISWLGVLLLRGPLNRQLTIGRFLGVLTQGQVGAAEPTLPTKGQAVQWAQAAVRGEVVEPINRLPGIIESYAAFASSSPGQF
jgi:hypothetical protein